MLSAILWLQISYPKPPDHDADRKVEGRKDNPLLEISIYSLENESLALPGHKGSKVINLPPSGKVVPLKSCAISWVQHCLNKLNKERHILYCSQVRHSEVTVSRLTMISKSPYGLWGPCVASISDMVATLFACPSFSLQVVDGEGWLMSTG